MNAIEFIHHVPRGAVLIVHASFKACAAAGLTPETVIHALLDRLGPEGTLMMPTFSYCYLHHPRGKVYDPASTPGVLNGILSETFRQMPGVLRSGNPTYSVAASVFHFHMIDIMELKKYLKANGVNVKL